MLSDRHRHLLRDLERQFEHEDPDWVRQFTDFATPRPTRINRALEMAIGLALVLAAAGFLLGSPEVVLSGGVVALTLALIRYSRHGVAGPSKS